MLFLQLGSSGYLWRMCMAYCTVLRGFLWERGVGVRWVRQRAFLMDGLLLVRLADSKSMRCFSERIYSVSRQVSGILFSSLWCLSWKRPTTYGRNLPRLDIRLRYIPRKYHHPSCRQEIDGHGPRPAAAVRLLVDATPAIQNILLPCPSIYLVIRRGF
jgi:hypothetical protein